MTAERSELNRGDPKVTSSNHAKLTDFGGCRPVTDEVRDSLST